MTDLPPTSRDGLADQLRHLESFVARAEADGDTLPPEAREMVDRLREIVAALDGLTKSLDSAPDTGPADPAG